MTERWDDWVKTCGKPTAWCGFDWPMIAESYVVFPQSAEHCRDEEIERLRGLVRCLLENDPDDDAADGVSVLDVWRKEAARSQALTD